MSRIAITGATGLVGAALVTQLIATGHEVLRLVRKPLGNDRYYDLHADPAPDLLQNIDVLIHAAFDRDDRGVKEGINYTSARALFALARLAGVKQMIFISSIAAQPTIGSSYGKSKLAIESLLDEQRDLVIRPGLVIGAAGLFGRLRDTVLQKKWIPLINGGKQSMQIISLADLVRFVEGSINEERKGLFTVVNEETFTYRELFRSIAAHYGRSIRFLSVPSAVLSPVLKLADRFRIGLPVSNENLAGLISQKPVSSSIKHIMETESLQNALATIDAAHSIQTKAAQ